MGISAPPTPVLQGLEGYKGTIPSCRLCFERHVENLGMKGNRLLTQAQMLDSTTSQMRPRWEALETECQMIDSR